jgi:hypothetical protein
LDDFTVAIIEQVAPYTLTSPDRIASLVEAVRYVVRAEVPGDFVECGVWRGGSMMAVALTLSSLGVRDRGLHLFDTFTHMPLPGEHDFTVDGRPANELYAEAIQQERYAYLPLQAVRTAMASTGYPEDRLHFVEGLVEDTIPSSAPETIALCRLDTDWYESTYHELVHLWPRISQFGVLIVDDYGEFLGCRKAVDQYILEQDLPVLLQRIDPAGRLALKR